MKRLIILAITAFISLVTHAQLFRLLELDIEKCERVGNFFQPQMHVENTGHNYRPFIEEGKVWKVGHTGDYPGWFDRATFVDYFYFDGDTIVEGRPCKKMMCRREFTLENWYEEPTTKYVGALYEENRRVYCALPNSTDFVLLYDFVSPVGTEFAFYSTEENKMTKGYIKDRFFREDGTFHGWVTPIPYYFVREERYIDFDETVVTWREGVGYNGFYNSLDWFYTGGMTILMTCTFGDEVLYYNPSIKDGVTHSDDGDEVKKNTIDFTHVVKAQPKAPRREGSADEETLTGEYSIKELFVNFKPLAGPYVITICNDSGTEVYRKEVQTSNVIGLNTDISGYAPGEYTITVENDAEAYTASINIDEAVGIGRPTPDPSRNGGEKAGAVFDLSGRQIVNSKSSNGKLNKGIYIRDGRKVVVR